MGAAPNAGAERILEAERTGRPGWTLQAGTDREGYMSFIGRSPRAASIEEGRAKGLADAAAQAVAAMGIRVSNGLLFDASAAGVRTERATRAYSEGVLRGMRVKDVYWERYRPGWLSLRSYYRVFILAEVARSDMEAEKRRLKGEKQAFSGALERLCAGAVRFLKARPAQEPAVVAGFHEAARETRHGLARVIEENLRGCLAQSGIPVTGGRDAEWLVTGTYTLGVDDALLQMRVERRMDGRSAAAAQAALPREAIDPDWLTQAPRDDGFLVETGPAPVPGALPPGGLSINPTPRGAATYVDGVLRGTGRVFIRDVAPGAHAVAVRFGGWKDEMRVVQVKSGEAVILEPVLVRPKGRIKVESAPTGARVFIDDRLMGRAPFVSAPIQVGEYLVRVEIPRHQPFMERVTVEADKMSALVARLEPMPGRLFLSSHPKGARFTIDDGPGRQAGDDGTLLIEGVPPGQRCVCAARAGYAPECQNVAVAPLSTAQLSFDLRRGEGGVLMLAGWAGHGRIRVDGKTVFSEAGSIVIGPGRHEVEARGDGMTWSYSGGIAPGEMRKITGRVMRGEGVLAKNAIRPTAYLEVLGGTVGGGGRLGTMSELHLFKYIAISPKTRLGLGSSLFELRSPGGSVRRRETMSGFGGTTEVSSGDRQPWVGYLFPLHASFTPLVLRSGTSISFGGTFSSWGRPFYGGQEWEASPRFNAKVVDGGMDVSFKGSLALRVGYMRQEIPAFHAGEDPKYIGGGRGAQYGALSRQGFYVAARISLGGVYAAATSRGGRTHE